MFASVEDFRNLKPAYEDVPVPELGEGRVVRVRCMSALVRDRWEQSNFTIGADGTVTGNFEGTRTRMLAAACCAEDFTPLFSEADVEWLNEVRSDVVDRLFDVAERLNGINAGLELAKKVFAAIRSGAKPTT